MVRLREQCSYFVLKESRAVKGESLDQKRVAAGLHIPGPKVAARPNLGGPESGAGTKTISGA
jgi:predicted XRE-type DNA-binding protein